MNTKRRAIHLSRIFRSRIPFRKPGASDHHCGEGELLDDPYSKNPASIDWCMVALHYSYGLNFEEAEKNNPEDWNYPCFNDWGY